MPARVYVHQMWTVLALGVHALPIARQPTIARGLRVLLGVVSGQLVPLRATAATAKTLASSLTLTLSQSQSQGYKHQLPNRRTVLYDQSCDGRLPAPCIFSSWLALQYYLRLVHVACGSGAVQGTVLTQQTTPNQLHTGSPRNLYLKCSLILRSGVR